MIEKLIAFFRERESDLPEFSGLNRQSAMHEFERVGLPNAKMEKWQKSVVKKFVEKGEFTFASKLDPSGNKMILKEDADSLIFHLFQPFDDSKALWQHESGAMISSIRFASRAIPQVFNRHFNQYSRQDLNGFTAVNAALTDQGYFIYFPKGFALEKSIHFIFENKTNGGFELTRNLIVIEDNASASLMQSELIDVKHFGFESSMTEIYVGNGARFSYFKEQDLGKHSGSVSNVFVHQEKDSESTVLTAGITGGLLRNEVHVRMNDEGGTANVYGVYLPGTGEQTDNQVFIDHAFPNCQSNELFKGVLNGEGTSVFNGHILVRQDAQKTNAYQKNRNILLSDAANAFAKPFLEIYADDVKCSHGATIGQLDENALFYLQSRGLSLLKAKEFLVQAFLGEILDICPHEGFRKRLEKKIEQKLHQ